MSQRDLASRPARRLLLGVAFTLVALLAAAPPANATDAYPTTDDKSTTINTGVFGFQGIDAAGITTQLTNHNARLTQIRVMDPTVPTFAVTMVSNTGFYLQTWAWYIGETEAQLNSLLTTNNGRLISVQGYDPGTGVVFAAVMVSNTGLNQRTWWWYPGIDSTTLSTDYLANHARLVDLSSRTASASTVYDVIMIHNDSNDPAFPSDPTADNRGWRYDINATLATVATDLSTNNFRLISLSAHVGNPATWDAIMITNEGEGWHYYSDLDAAGIVSNLGSDLARPISLAPYLVSGVWHYALVDLDDLNLTQAPINVASTAAQTFADTNATWNTGFNGGYFADAGNLGSPAVAWNSGFRFATASTIKVLYLLYTLQQATLGNIALTDNITYYYTDATFPPPPTACPQAAWEIPADAHTTTVQTAITEMMQNSNDVLTRAFAIKWGLPAIQTMATGLGLSNTHLRQPFIGCSFQGGFRDEFTLQDAAKVYAIVNNGGGSLSSTYRNTFFATLAGGALSAGSGVGVVITSEKTILGKSAAVATQFLNTTEFRYKAGYYDLCLDAIFTNSCNPHKDDLSVAGRLLIPTMGPGGAITQKAYVISDFVNDGFAACQATQACETAATTMVYSLAGELARSTIHTALATFDDDSDGDGYTNSRETALGKSNSVYCAVMRADIDGDGSVSILDLAATAAHFLEPVVPLNARFNQDGDGSISILDLATMASHFLQSVSTSCT